MQWKSEQNLGPSEALAPPGMLYRQQKQKQRECTGGGAGVLRTVLLHAHTCANMLHNTGR